MICLVSAMYHKFLSIQQIYQQLDYEQIHLVPLIDPVMNLVHNGLSSDIRDVYVAGRKVIEKGRSLFIDESALMKEAQERCLSLWEKVRGN